MNTAGKNCTKRDPEKYDWSPQCTLHRTKNRSQSCNVKKLYKEQFPFGKDYGDEAAVNDTAAEVRALQRKGICVSAVFMGTDAGALKAEIIYGKEYTRIQEVGQLARASGLLIQKEISKINS